MLKLRTKKASHALFKRGIIIKENCLCGSPHTHMHHPDYNDPWNVVWMCRPCHDEFHTLERKVMASICV